VESTDDNSALCASFMNLPNRAAEYLLAAPFTMTLYWTCLFPMPIDYEDYVRNERREWPTPREWLELANRLQEPADR